MLLRLCLLTVFLALLWSCRNEDFAGNETKPQRNNADFFRHASSSATAKSGVDYISILEAYNRETDFLSTMPDQQGMPIWDKMQVLDVADETVLYVPLSADETALSSLLVVKVDEADTVSHLQNFTNDYLKTYAYNLDYPADKRRFLMDTFLQMDFLCFGQQQFTNLPTDLYKGFTEYNRVNILEITKESTNNGKFIYGSLCATIHACANGCTLLACDYSNCQHGGKCHVWKSCTNTVDWIDDPSTAFPSSPSCGPGCGGGGGGTPGSGGNPPKDPCAPTGINKAFYRMLTGCQGNSNDEDDGIFQDPCEKIKKSTNDSKYKSNITNLEGKTGLNHEEGYRLGNPISGSGQTGTQNQLLQNLPGTHEVDMKIFSNTFALMHTHYDGIYPIFSPGDILLFNNWIVWANTWNAVPTNTPKISLNNLTLTVVTSNGNYLLAFDGSIVDPLPAYTQEQFDNLNKDYKEDYLDTTHTNGNFNMEKVEKEFLGFISERMNMVGLKLYKVKSDGNYEISLNDLDGIKCP